MRAPRLFPEDIELDDRLDAMISADPDGDGAEYAGAFASLLRELAYCQRAHREDAMLPDDCPITHRKAVEFKTRASRDAGGRSRRASRTDKMSKLLSTREAGAVPGVQDTRGLTLAPACGILIAVSYR